jgi:peroxiredoxin
MPRVGQSAKNFTLEAHGGGKVSLASAVRRGGPVVLVVLRGYPGYQ